MTQQKDNTIKYIIWTLILIILCTLIWSLFFEMHNLQVDLEVQTAASAACLLELSEFVHKYDVRDNGFITTTVTPDGAYLYAMTEEWYEIFYLDDVLQESTTILVRNDSVTIVTNTDGFVQRWRGELTREDT